MEMTRPIIEGCEEVHEESASQSDIVSLSEASEVGDDVLDRGRSPSEASMSSVDGSEGVFHVQSLFDEDSAVHHEGSIQIGNSHSIGGDSGWSSQCGANDQRVEVVHALAKNDAFPPTSRRDNFQTEIGGESAVFPGGTMAAVVGPESSE